MKMRVVYIFQSKRDNLQLQSSIPYNLITMSALNTLSNGQKAQLRNAFTLIDGESRDSSITKADLISLYKTLELKVPDDDSLKEMLTIDGEFKETGVNFTQFSNIMAKELQKYDDRMTIYNALKVFLIDSHNHELVIDVEVLKEACCSVQLGELGSGDNRLSRQAFDQLVEGFVKEQIDGTKLFTASKWLDAYID